MRFSICVLLIVAGSSVSLASSRVATNRQMRRATGLEIRQARRQFRQDDFGAGNARAERVLANREGSFRVTWYHKRSLIELAARAHNRRLREASWEIMGRLDKRKTDGLDGGQALVTELRALLACGSANPLLQARLDKDRQLGWARDTVQRELESFERALRDRVGAK